MFELRLQINTSWFEQKFKAENTELESSKLTMSPRILNISTISTETHEQHRL